MSLCSQNYNELTLVWYQIYLCTYTSGSSSLFFKSVFVVRFRVLPRILGRYVGVGVVTNHIKAPVLDLLKDKACQDRIHSVAIRVYLTHDLLTAWLHDYMTSFEYWNYLCWSCFLLSLPVAWWISSKAISYVSSSPPPPPPPRPYFYFDTENREESGTCKCVCDV